MSSDIRMPHKLAAFAFISGIKRRVQELSEGAKEAWIPTLLSVHIFANGERDVT